MYPVAVQVGSTECSYHIQFKKNSEICSNLSFFFFPQVSVVFTARCDLRCFSTLKSKKFLYNER